MGLARRYAEVRARVDAAAAHGGRDPHDVTVVAVAKTFGASVVQEAIDAGISDIGENRAQELADKVELVGDRATWHFVGRLQTNKVRQVVGVASLIHSVDRMRLAEAIAARATSVGLSQRVLIEVNIGADPSKSGTAPESVMELAAGVDRLDGLDVCGLMTIPPYPERPEDSRPFYKELASLRDQIAEQLPSVRQLSMGMTRDFEVAVEEGATLVRVGEAIFGSRRR